MLKGIGFILILSSGFFGTVVFDFSWKNIIVFAMQLIAFFVFGYVAGIKEISEKIETEGENTDDTNTMG